MTAIDYAEVSGSFAQSGDVRIHYGEVGSGAPVIFLHGTGPGSSGWFNFKHNIAAVAEHYRAIVLDLPRFGKSSKVVVEGPRLSYMARVLADFMDALDIERAHFIGNSMGGQTALKVAIDSPERVDRLVVIGPAIMHSSVFTPMPTEGVRKISEYYHGEGPTREKMRSLMETLVFDAKHLTDDEVEERYQASVDPEVLAVNQGPHWARQSLVDELDAVTAKTLIVWGQEDRASPLDHGLVLLRRLRDARMHILPKSGHSVQSECPEEFNQLVLAFLDPSGDL